MSIESQLRKEMYALIKRTCQLPHKTERERLLWDTLYFVAKQLGVEVQDGGS
jgi:hypothetical protein